MVSPGQNQFIKTWRGSWLFKYTDKKKQNYKEYKEWNMTQPKEENKSPETNIKEMEICELSEK